MKNQKEVQTEKISMKIKVIELAESRTMATKLYMRRTKKKIFHVEIKSSNDLSENWEKHPDFMKLLNLLKYEIDNLLKLNCPDEISVYGCW